MIRSLVALFLALLIAGCTTHALSDRTADESFALLSGSDRSICWAGMCIGDARSRVEAAIRTRLRPKEDYTDVCGGYFAHPLIAGRRVMLEFSSPRADGELEVIGVPFTSSERLLTEDQLSRAARQAIPRLVDGTAIEYGTPERANPLYLTLPSNHDVAINIKPDEPEKTFYVTHAGCVD